MHSHPWDFFGIKNDAASGKCKNLRGLRWRVWLDIKRRKEEINFWKYFRMLFSITCLIFWFAFLKCFLCILSVSAARILIYERQCFCLPLLFNISHGFYPPQKSYMLTCFIFWLSFMHFVLCLLFIRVVPIYTFYFFLITVKDYLEFLHKVIIQLNFSKHFTKGGAILTFSFYIKSLYINKVNGYSSNLITKIIH